MKQEFQYAIGLQLFDDRIIFNLICQLCITVWRQVRQWSHLVFFKKMSREQQDMQSFADGNLQHKLDLSNWRVN